ncbi:Hsp20/alpha crystallin family protein [Sulfurovum sp. bin170]|uniref:Hsp20/alpha crystallin family protein n=1 Tax=Sulfurovum sp. bin170 TaxID=2695268 RepID=UPI0013DEB5CF|nr:Hsp20/alpha crystallin family protein [Sulfurovum sp. bin170]NEW60603.1 Hsp20/alpha crystallin family protein [Sulfurovum sp. bin170]
MNKTLTITLNAILLTTITAVSEVNLEEEMYAPAREMMMLDRAMERGMDEHNQKVQNVNTIIDEGVTIDNSPMTSFQEFDKKYELVENIDDPKNTKVKVSIEGSGVKIEATTETSEKSKTQAGVVESSSSSSTVQVIPIPFDADGQKMKSVYIDGVLIITVPKKNR